MTTHAQKHQADGLVTGGLVREELVSLTQVVRQLMTLSLINVKLSWDRDTLANPDEAKRISATPSSLCQATVCLFVAIILLAPSAKGRCHHLTFITNEKRHC